MSQQIFFYTDDPGVGGVAEDNHLILCSLAKLGYHVTYLQPHSQDDRKINQQKDLGIKHIWLKQDGLHFWEENYNLENWELTLKNCSDQPDLIICSNCQPFSNFAIKQIAIKWKIPYIIHEGLVMPELAECFPEYLDELSDHYNQAQSVIAVSSDDLGLLRQLFKLPEHKGQVIHYGRPPEYFTPCDQSVRDRLRQSLNIPTDAVVCFTAARLEIRKGYQYQLEAIKQLMQRNIWPQLYFIWAGSAKIGEQELEIELKQTVKELNITDKVIFLGHRLDVADWLNVADIFVFPSRLEGMPLGVMEAMAKGLPVIATAISGIPEELGHTGKLLSDPNISPQATITELVTTIETWVKNPQLRQIIGENCRKRAEKMFKSERMITEIIEVIENIIYGSKL